ncbi:alpha/beta fold hydrolase [Microbacterium betulae]|uniref:Alpha/beta fold hydrolase n=1 Tax=Microbacterium betulae TaxID=2981139 RepID=A0AA97FH90_9MICO|nr:alpha/beta fold hydrolase [Microbacterium sp. AB]WOF23526.1 alpha/beta fold hydrolase [Microbacterium sp. AB]
MPEYVDAHGVVIVYDLYEPEGEARGVVQILHGVGDHAGRYAVLAEALAAQGFAVYADDHRGHGRTGIRQHGGPERLGRLGVGGHGAAVAAVWQLTELIRAERPGLPVVLLGHSWGSFLAQKLFDEHPDAYDAVVLVGSSLRWPGSLNAGDLNARWKTEGANGVEWLSSDPEVQRAFLDDPLTTSVPLLRLFGPRGALQLYGRPRRGLRERAGADVPVLLLVGRDDSVGGPRAVHRLAKAYRERAGLADVTTLVYEGRHEILKEPVQAAVRADLLAWLDARIPARS